MRALCHSCSPRFLMPQDDIIDELKGLTLDQTADIKSRWKVSMVAIIRRAKDLSATTLLH